MVNKIKENRDNIIAHNDKRKVKDETIKATEEALFKIKQETNKNFFDEIDVHIIPKISNFEPFSYYSELVKFTPGHFKGMFLDGDTDIYINEQRILKYQKKHNIPNNNTTKYVIFHEIGHFFDEYYGCKINNYEETLLKLGNSYHSIKNIEELYNLCYNNNSFSDEAVFKEALFKDLSNLSMKDLKCLYTGYDRITRTNFDLKRCIDEMDSLRSEIFADVFAILMGGEDEDKEFYTETFKETSKVVAKFIEDMKDVEKPDIRKININI